MASITSGAPINAEKTAVSVILAVSFCHMMNDIMQSLLTSLYPLLKENYALDFVQIGLLTFAFQVTASLLQPAVGVVEIVITESERDVRLRPERQSKACLRAPDVSIVGLVGL